MPNNNELPPALQGLLDKASRHRSNGDQLVFMGSLQDPVPRHLIIDPDLPASAVRIWAYFRSYITTQADSIKCPTYVEIMRDLNIGSRETVAMHLSLLRATRWISLAARTKNGRGFTRGNIYALHTQPISIADAMVLDEEYMSLLIKLSQHQNPKYHRLASLLIESAEHFFDSETTTPSLDAIEQSLLADQVRTPLRSSLRLFYQRPVSQPKPSQNVTELKHDSGTIFGTQGVATGKDHSGTIFRGHSVAKESETGKKPFIDNNAPNSENNSGGHTVATPSEIQSTIIVPPEYDNRTAFCSSSSFNKKPTTTKNIQKNNSGTISELRKRLQFHDDIFGFNDNLKNLAAKSLIRVGDDDQQMVLDCLAAQVKMAAYGQAKPVRVPIKLIQWHVGQILDGKNSLSGLHPDDVKSPQKIKKKVRAKLDAQDRARQQQEEAQDRAHQERLARLLKQKGEEQGK